MLGKHRIALDKWADCYRFLGSYADEVINHQQEVEFRPDTVYIFGPSLLTALLDEILKTDQCNVIFCRIAEGSQTLKWQLRNLGVEVHIRSGRIGFMMGGDPDLIYKGVTTDIHFTDIINRFENQIAHTKHPLIYQSPTKPYTFLMLNGRLRSHRKYLIDALRDRGLLDRALWSNLHSQTDLRCQLPLSSNTEPIKLLPIEYEIRSPQSGESIPVTGFVKDKLFQGMAWGDAIINPRAYIDTYFSLVTETVFEYPCSFPTEKIWKPIIMCHPFVVAANRGFYRDLHQRGFRTFGNLIDESFDLVDNLVDRAQRIVAVVEDICYNGPEQFLQAAKPICEFNYQRLIEYNQQEKPRLVGDLETYLDKRII